MSSFKPVDYSNNTPIDKSEQRQQQLPSPRQPYPHQDHYLQQQRQHQHQQHPAQHPQHPPQHPSQQQHPEQYPRRHQDMYDMQQHNAGLLHGPRMMARMDGEEEEMVVIGSGISGSFEPRAKPRVPMRLPNLDYKYPKASAQNFSPGTSLIFNAYRGHGGLLTQPYMAAIENGAAHDESYQETRRSISHEAHAEQQQQQQLTYQPHESNSYSSSPYRQQKSLEHPSYRTPHEHSFHSYQANGQPDARDYRDYHESRESRDPREYENPGIRSSQRSPGMTPPSSMAMSGSSDQLSHRIEQGHEGRARAPEHYEPHRSRDDYSSQLSTQPPRRIPSDAGHNIPPPQRWKGPDGDQGNTSHSYDGNNQYQSHHFQSQPQPQQQQQQQQQPPHPTPPMDIPQPRHRGSTNYPNEYNHRESMDHSMRGQQSQYSRPHHAQYPHSQHSEHAQHAEQTMGQGSYQSFGPRSTGPRYALTRVNYRMV
ncbi:MAG: hypothetical protein J3Q66DRAFT_108728 [Benniella sp.]|nr:MAG: hypothetical protein J3Q66DRAFT_108728 [Benniella sp.]